MIDNTKFGAFIRDLRKANDTDEFSSKIKHF